MDNSQSIRLNHDTTSIRQSIATMLHRIEEGLGNNADIRFMTFGEEVKEGNSITLNEKRSDYEKLFLAIEERFSQRNIGAVILAGDGLYNQGTDPLYNAVKSSFPIYTIGLGNPTNIKGCRL